MSKRATDELLASLQHRLTQLDEIGHRTSLLETINSRVADMDGRLDAATIDMEAISALAVNVRGIVEVLAERLEAIERRLDALAATRVRPSL